MKANRTSRKVRRAEGFYLVLTAILIFVVCAFLALVVGIGLQAINKSKLQNIANLTAWAGLEAFVNSPSLAGYDVKAANSLARAKNILLANNLIAAPQAFGPVTTSAQPLQMLWDGGGDPVPAGGSSGTITLGNWYVTPPASGSDPCGTRGLPYPCFIPNAAPSSSSLTPTSPMNAVRVNLRNQNPILSPFVRILGYTGFNLEAHATSALVQRCTALLIDLSGSVNHDSHVTPLTPTQWFISPTGNVNWNATPHPTFTAPFVNSASPLYREEISIPADYASCTTIPAATPPIANVNRECALWHNLDPVARTSVTDPVHHRSDFMQPADDPSTTGFVEYVEETKDVFGNQIQVLIDKFYHPPDYRGPQPYETFLHGFNSGIRNMMNQAIAGDRVMMLGFSGAKIGQVGPTTDLGLMAQITNYMNVGLYSLPGTPYVEAGSGETSVEAHPNVLDFGFYPVPGPGLQGSTHLPSALHTAKMMLSQYCPVDSKKSVVLATDGIVNCRYNNFDDPANSVNPAPYRSDSSTGSTCGNTWNDYLLGEQQVELLTTELSEQDISVTTLVSGDAIGTNYRALANPNGGYYSFPEAVALGQKANYVYFGAPDQKKGAGDGNAQAAFNNLYSAGNHFYRALQLLENLAADTKGLYCPLLDPQGTGCSYDVAGNSLTLVDNGSPMTCPTTRNSMAQQAAACVIAAIGLNPFVLVEEE